jgi:2-polyprenyl-6-methoxyphenol hydroxylase-like FAD-dependent oxidoreductase
MPCSIAILGAGPAGLTLALALSKRQEDITFMIFERAASHLEAAKYNPYRSYTIDITGHGIKAAKYVNVVDRFNEELICFKGIYFVSNPLKPIWDGKIPSKGWTGSRGDICSVLLKELELRTTGSSSKIHFDSSVTSISVPTGCLTVEHHDGLKKRELVYTFDLIVAADGGGSMARSAMQGSVPEFTVTSHELPNHSRMLHMDQNTGALDPGYLHVMGLPPLFLVAGAINGERGRDSPKWFCQVGTIGKREYASPEEAQRHVSQVCPSLLTYASDRAFADFSSRECMPTGKSKVCSSFASGRVVLLGDAAAPFPPVGQGVNAAMEGAIVLDQCIGRALAASPQPPDLGTLARAALEYDRLWRDETGAMRAIAQELDFRQPLPSTLRAMAYALVGCSALQNSKDEVMPYSAALRRQRMLDGVLLGCATAVAALVVWRFRRPNQ